MIIHASIICRIEEIAEAAGIPVEVHIDNFRDDDNTVVEMTGDDRIYELTELVHTSMGENFMVEEVRRLGTTFIGVIVLTDEELSEYATTIKL